MSHSKLSVSEGKDYVSSAVWYKYSQQQQQTQIQTGSNPATVERRKRSVVLSVVDAWTNLLAKAVTRL